MNPTYPPSPEKRGGLNGSTHHLLGVYIRWRCIDRLSWRDFTGAGTQIKGAVCFYR